MNPRLNDKPFVLERSGQVFFVGSQHDEYRRIVNLRTTPSIEFHFSKTFDDSETELVAKVRIDIDRYYSFHGIDAQTLYDYFVGQDSEIPDDVLDSYLDNASIPSRHVIR
jgi:hypothetical protein